MKVSRNQLKGKCFYYNGCETETVKVKDSEAEADINIIINLAADVLIDILTREEV